MEKGVREVGGKLRMGRSLELHEENLPGGTGSLGRSSAFQSRQWSGSACAVTLMAPALFRCGHVAGDMWKGSPAAWRELDLLKQPLLETILG